MDDHRAIDEATIGAAVVAAVVVQPRCVRRCDVPRFPPTDMLTTYRRPLVEYELVLDDNDEEEEEEAPHDSILAGQLESEPSGLLAFLLDKTTEDRIVWVSDRCYLRSPEHALIYPGGFNLWIPVCMYRNRSSRTWRSPVSLDLVGFRGELAADASEHIPEADLLLRLVKRHAHAEDFVLDAISQDSWLPVSGDALRLLVDYVPPDWDSPNPWQVARTRSVAVISRLTEEHKRNLAFGCHPNVELKVDLNLWTRDGSGIQLLVDAIRQNACPRQLSLNAYFPRDRDTALEAFRSLMEAMEGNTCLERLEVYLPDPWLGAGEFAANVDLQTEFVKLLIPSLPRCHGLRSLTLWDSDRASAKITFESLWKPFWDCIASHPTLRSLTLFACELSTFSTPQLEEMASCLQANTSLQHLRSRDDGEDGGDVDHLPVLRDRLLPVLRLNRFRPVVAYLLLLDDSVRANSFCWLLQNDYIRSVVGHTFFLMTEANEVFTDVLSRHRRTRHNRLVPEA